MKILLIILLFGCAEGDKINTLEKPLSVNKKDICSRCNRESARKECKNCFIGE